MNESIQKDLKFKLTPNPLESVSNIKYYFSHSSPNVQKGKIGILKVNHFLRHFDEIVNRVLTSVTPADPISIEKSSDLNGKRLSLIIDVYF